MPVDPQFMDSFRTTLPSSSFSWQLDYHRPILSLGSCFAEHLGQRLTEAKFPVLSNPFGILYHPLVLAQALDRLGSDQAYKAEDLFLHQDLWRHFDFHSRYAHPDKDAQLQLINQQRKKGQDFLAQARVLILTLGTAWGYRWREDGRLVANCHKLPTRQFDRFRSSPEEVVEALGAALRTCRQRNPKLHVLLTVSPVRHIRDGLVENQRSKAVLLLATERLARQLDFVDYFPAYELVLDDLRDYRFFEPDLTHPNSLAVDYVWEHFTQATWTPDTRSLAQAVLRLVRAARHRPFHPETPGHQAFVQRTLAQMTELEGQHPFLDFAAEKAHLTL
jgi:hypothetical protein